MLNLWMNPLLSLEQRIDIANGEITRLKENILHLELRLAEEIKWGHRNCQFDNCVSSGTDCPVSSSLRRQEGQCLNDWPLGEEPYPPL